MTRKTRKTVELSENERLIAEALGEAERPLSAYDLIERLRGRGIVSPPTVYRALKRLVEFGLAHRIESLNAFVCCAHAGHEGQAAFAICDDCGSVTEFHRDSVVGQLGEWAKGQSFDMNKVTIELHGKCSGCATSESGQVEPAHR